MTVSELVADLRSRGVALLGIGTKLRVDAPPDSLTDELRIALEDRWREVLDFIRAETEGHHKYPGGGDGDTTPGKTGSERDFREVLSPSPPLGLLRALTSKGVRIAADGCGLRWLGPVGLVSAQLKIEVESRSHELLRVVDRLNTSDRVALGYSARTQLSCLPRGGDGDTTPILRRSSPGGGPTGPDRRMAISRAYHCRLLKRAATARRRCREAETPLERGRLIEIGHGEVCAARNVRLARRFFGEMAR